MVKFETSEAPTLTISECGGDLKIIAGNAGQVLVEADGPAETLSTARAGDMLTFNAGCDCTIECPAGTLLSVGQVRGDLYIRGVSGTLAIKSVRGDATLRSVGPANVGSVRGDLKVRDTHADVTIDEVNGDVRLRRIEGGLALAHGRGDLKARQLLGGAQVDQVEGDILLESEFTPGRTYRLSGRGDLKAAIPPNSNARFKLEARGRLHCNLDLHDGTRTPHHITGQVGNGEALVELQAEGAMSVDSAGPSWAPDLDLHTDTAQFEAHIAEVERQLNERLTALDEIGDKLASKSVERARRHAEKEIERARRKATVFGRHAPGLQAGWDPSLEPAAEPVGEEERLAILRMIEQKKITASQGALLLEALEGEAR